MPTNGAICCSIEKNVPLDEANDAKLLMCLALVPTTDDLKPEGCKERCNLFFDVSTAPLDDANDAKQLMYLGLAPTTYDSNQEGAFECPS